MFVERGLWLLRIDIESTILIEKSIFCPALPEVFPILCAFYVPDVQPTITTHGQL
jgi:hypothetical protein